MYTKKEIVFFNEFFVQTVGLDFKGFESMEDFMKFLRKHGESNARKILNMKSIEQ